MTHATVPAIRPPFNHVVAFEVSKESLVVHTLPIDEQSSIANRPQAVRRLLKAEIKRNRTGEFGPLLIVCEATGGYERHVLDAALETAFKAIEAEIAELVSATDSLKHKVRLMRTVKGVGLVTATTLLAYLPDIGQLTKGQVARRTGLAPINDSGKKRGPRHVEAGRSEIRRCLYMAAVVAANFNPVLREFAARLKARGYPFKYVITAVMRKLVVILNPVLRDGEPWKGAKTA